MIRLGRWKHAVRHAYVLGIAIVATTILCPSAADAQRRYLGMGHTLRLEGIVEPAEDKDVLGEIRIRSGDALRRFGVTSAIAPGEDGMAIFRNQRLRRETFKLVGTDDLLRPFHDAKAGTKLHLMGVLQPDSFLISSIDVLSPAPRTTQ